MLVKLVKDPGTIALPSTTVVLRIWDDLGVPQGNHERPMNFEPSSKAQTNIKLTPRKTRSIPKLWKDGFFEKLVFAIHSIRKRLKNGLQTMLTKMLISNPRCKKKKIATSTANYSLGTQNGRVRFRNHSYLKNDLKPTSKKQQANTRRDIWKT